MTRPGDHPGRLLRERLGLRVAVVCTIPVACNRATADFMISSPLMSRIHEPWDPMPDRHEPVGAAGGR